MRVNLRLERLHRGLSGSRLAELAHIPQPTYSKMERGDIPAYPKWREAVVAALRKIDGKETVFDTELLFLDIPE